jgi:DNA-binding NarL/FixJ family response regulator
LVVVACARRVLLGDGDRRSRAATRRVLEWGGFPVCAEADDLRSAVALAIREQPDVAVLDGGMIGDGVRAAEAVGRASAGVAIVMICPDEERLFPALRAGVSGYVLRDTVPHLLVPAVRSVLDDGAALSSSMVARLLEEFRPPQQHRLRRRGTTAVRLTEREWEVLELLAAGMTSAEIGTKLDIRAVTVRTHVSAIVRKLGAEDRDAAARLFSER